MTPTKDTIERMRQMNGASASQRFLEQRQASDHSDQTAIRNTILDAFGMLIKYLDGRVGKAYIMNQLESIDTPDALKVAEAVESLHETLKTHENTDLTPVTNLLSKLLEETTAIPKELAAIEIPSSVEVKNFKDYSKDFKALETAIKAIQLVAEAPQITLPAPEVTVTPADIDLSPIDKGLKTLEKAVKSITIPETNMIDVEKLLKKTNKLLGEILDKPVGGGGGGGRVSPYQTADGVPSFVELVNGAVPVVGLSETSSASAVRLDDTSTANMTYIGKADTGTASSSSTWQIARLDTSSGLIKTWADGNANYDNTWDNRTSYDYS